MTKPKDPNPFELLLEDMTKAGARETVSAPSGLNFGSLLKANDKRKETRSQMTGLGVIYLENKEPHSKVVLRDISTGGLSVEAHPVPLQLEMTVFVELYGSGSILGKIKCIIKRLSVIEGHAKGHRQVGLQFADKSPDFKIKVERFIKSLGK